MSRNSSTLALSASVKYLGLLIGSKSSVLKRLEVSVCVVCSGYQGIGDSDFEVRLDASSPEKKELQIGEYVT